MQPYFMWNDIDSRSLGVWVAKLPDIIRPVERVTSVQIYGRAGTLHTSEGSNVYDSYEKVVSILVRPEADIGSILNTFRGAGKAIFSNEANRIYTAYISQPLQLKREGTWLLSCDIRFEVQPFKVDVVRPSSVTVTSGGTVNNPGDVELYPVITVTGKNLITMVVGSDTVKIDTKSSTDKTYVLDCLNETCVDSNSQNANDRMSGNYPCFKTGNTTVTLTNVTTFSFLPDWLYL